jgi:predicted NBD/HSP70 family sugar kinase
LETYVADPGLIRTANQLYEDGILPHKVGSVDELLALAQEGNQEAREIYANAGKILGRGLANLINVLNPELIIVSGEGVRAKVLIFESMNTSIHNHVMPGLSEDTVIQIDTWEDDAWARGAAGLVLQDFFESPISRKQSSYSRA